MPSTKIFNSINKPRSKFFYNESFHPEYLNTLYIDLLIKRKFHERKLEINKPRSKFLLSINSSKSCRLNIYIYTHHNVDNKRKLSIKATCALLRGNKANVREHFNGAELRETASSMEFRKAIN